MYNITAEEKSHLVLSMADASYELQQHNCCILETRGVDMRVRDDRGLDHWVERTPAGINTLLTYLESH